MSIFVHLSAHCIMCIATPAYICARNFRSATISFQTIVIFVSQAIEILIQRLSVPPRERYIVYYICLGGIPGSSPGRSLGSDSPTEPSSNPGPTSDGFTCKISPRMILQRGRGKGCISRLWPSLVKSGAIWGKYAVCGG